jgi:hypothetical protein
VIVERQGIEIDYCPACRGVWLDRGELDKLLERAGGESRENDERELRRGRDEDSRDRRDEESRGRRDEDWRRRDRDDDDDDDRFKKRGYSEQHSHTGPKRKRESLLGELFDF